MTQIENQKSKIENLLALALIALLVLLFFWRILTPRLEDRAAFPPGDFTDQFWAFRMDEARAFAEGRLPLWSNNFNSGHPFLADVQSAVFYPIGLIWTLAVVAVRGANFTLGDLEIEAILHFILAGAFTYLFAKRLLGSRSAALVSALTFTFGGYLTSYPPQQLAILETATWLPLALLFLERGLTRINADVIASRPERSAAESKEATKQSPISNLQSLTSSTGIASHKPLAMTDGARYYLAAGVTLGIAALAGHPQTFLFVVYACVVYFAWRIIQQRNTEHAPRITFYVLRFILVLLIAAGISAVQWIPTLEYQTLSTRAAISWAEAAAGFPTLDPLQMILPGFVSAFQSPLYIGVLPLWLALFALFVNRSREKIFWGALALGALLLSFGAYAFAYALFYLFAPGFALFRGQERLALVISFSLALLAGYGFRELMQASFDFKRARRAWAWLPAGVTISILMLLTLYISGTLRQSGRVAFLGDRAALMTLLFLLASALVAALIAPSPVRRGRVGWGFALAFIVFDLFTINNPAYNAELKPRYPVTPIIETMQSDRGVFRVADEGRMPGHFGIAYNLEEIGGISPLRIAHYAALLDRLPSEKLWALLNVRYVITGRPGLTDAAVVAQDGDTRLLRLQNEMPRAWFVRSAQANVDDPTALTAMASASFDPRAVAYLAGELSYTQYPGAEQNTAQVIMNEPEHVVIAVETPAAAVLMVSQIYYPGWQVTIDGIPVQTRRADVALIAVPVQQGARRIELVFDPGSVKVGIAVTVATLLCVVGMLWYNARRGKRK